MSERKFMATIYATSRKMILKLSEFDLDISRGTTHMNTDQNFSVDGFLTLSQTEKIIDNGYHVLLKEDAVNKFKAADQVVTFSQWIGHTRKNLRKITDDKYHEFITGTDYLNTQGIIDAINDLSITYPSIVEKIDLDEPSRQGRSISALRLCEKSNSMVKEGIIFLGGVHAREIINPDLLITMAYNLAESYTSNKGLKIGNYSTNFSDIKNLLEKMDIFIIPLVNPDGRVHVQTKREEGGEPMWRKNMYPNPNSTDQCSEQESEGLEGNIGVDLNRNFDHMWSSGIGSRSKTCSINYRGAKPFSEPETRNIKNLIQKYSNIKWLIDVHSNGQTILYPWGFDEDQSNDPSMNFLNPVYEGQRGKLNDQYKEYIISEDLNKYRLLADNAANAISKVRNNNKYTVQQSALTGLTSASSDDYCYSLTYLNQSRNRKIMSYTFETATEFQPDFNPDGRDVIKEVSAGLIGFMQGVITNSVP